MPYGNRTLAMDFDFLADELLIATSAGSTATVALQPRSVADFYAAVMRELRALDIAVKIWPVPVEVEHPIPFEQDREHAAYDPEYARRFWRILVQAERVMTEFRSLFLGKVSPVHFFWGAFDLAVTRFSGRRAPEHPGAPNVADFVTRDAYSHEVSSCGFWPGGGPVVEPLFYAYAYPEPKGFADHAVRPEGARYSNELREFILPYEVVRRADDPDAALLAFFQSTYDAAAELGGWERANLERPRGAEA